VEDPDDIYAPPDYYDDNPPEGPIVPPMEYTDDDGNPTYKCPEGYKLIMSGGGYQCFRTTTDQRMRAGIGTRAYTQVYPSRYRRGQSTRTNRRTQYSPVIKT
jgi:hypothetical protein